MEDICNQLKIPEYLHRKGRPIDTEFFSEEIYRRFNASGSKRDWKNNRTISASIFKVNKDSCIREKHSQDPSDVLYNTRIEDKGNHYFGWGILVLNSDEVNQFQHELKINNDVRDFKLEVIHKPEECMYPHTEIIVLENGEQIDPNTPRSVKTLIRSLLIDICSILKDPEPEQNGE